MTDRDDDIWLDADQWDRIYEVLTRYRRRCMVEERERIDDLIQGIVAQRGIEFIMED